MQSKKKPHGSKSPGERRKAQIHAQTNMVAHDKNLSDIIEQQALARMGATTPLSYDSAREESQMNERYTFTQTETRQLKELQDHQDVVDDDEQQIPSSNHGRKWGPQGTTTTE